MRGTSSPSKALDLIVRGVVAVTDTPVDRLVLPLGSLLLDLPKEQTVVELTGGSPLWKTLTVDPRFGGAGCPGHVFGISLATSRLPTSPFFPAQLRTVSLQTPASGKSRSSVLLLWVVVVDGLSDSKKNVTWSLLAASSPASPFILLKLSGVPGTDAEGSALLGCHKKILVVSHFS